MITKMEWKSYGVLDIKPGDTLFIRIDEMPLTEHVRHLESILPGVNIIFVTVDVDITKLAANMESSAPNMDDPLWRDFVGFFDKMEKIL